MHQVNNTQQPLFPSREFFFMSHFHLFPISCHLRVKCYLLVMAVSQDPVLLLGVKKQAEDIEGQAVFLIGRPLIKANEQAALHLWVSQ